MNSKILFYAFILIISLSYCSIKFIPVNEEMRYCYNTFNKSISFTNYILSYLPKQDNYILRKIVNKNINKDIVLCQDNFKTDKYKEYIYLFFPEQFNNFVILQDKSIIIADKKSKKQKYYLSLYYFKYPPNENPDYYYENEEISLNLNEDIFIIKCSDMILIYSFGNNKNGVLLYILDEKMQKLYLREKICDNSASSLSAINLDENKNSILVCLVHSILECYVSKYEKKLINGNKLIIFEDNNKNKSYIYYCSMLKLNKNKVAIVYNTGFEIYYSNIIFDDTSLKFEILKSINLSNGFKFILNACNQMFCHSQNIVSLENIFNNYNGKITNAFINSACNSFIIDEIQPNEKFNLILKNKITEGINHKNEKIYISYINKKIQLYKNNKKISVNNEYDIQDKMDVIIDYSDKPLLLKYIYRNEECQIQLNPKRNYIFIEGKPHICIINKNNNQINNITYNELKDKIFDIFSKEFNFSLRFEKEVKNNELIFYLLKDKINCRKDKNDKNKIICKGSLPKLPLNTYYIDYDIYSTLS